MQTKTKLISAFTIFLLVFSCYLISVGSPTGRHSQLKQTATTACTIPDTVKYEAEHGTLIGASAYRKYQPNASNDTSVASHTGVEFIMQYPADAIKIRYGTGLTGTKNLKVNGVLVGAFTINNTGGYHILQEAELTVNVKAGDTVYVGDLTYIELDCIKAYKGAAKLPYVSVTSPSSYDTIPINVAATFTVSANDTDGTITAVQFKIANDTTYIDSTAPYSFTYTPTTLGHWGLVVTAYDNCNDSTVAPQRHYFVEDDRVDFVRYEAEHGTIIGAELGLVRRPGNSNDTNVQYLSYVDKGVQIIANEDADGVVIGYGTYQNGWFRLKVNGVNSGLFNIVHSNGYTNVHKAALNVPVTAGDTLFVTTPGPGGAYLELDYLETFAYRNILPQVSITNPMDYDTVYLDSTVVFAANASDTDGMVDSVKFLVEGYAPFVDATSPYTYSFTADSSGIKKITATAYDNDGDSTVSTLTRFFVRTIIPDSLKYEAEQGILKGIAAKAKTTGASNDSTVAYVNGTNNGVEFIMQYDADAIILGYGTGNSTPGTAKLKINGVTHGSTFTTGYTGGYGTTRETVITTPVSAGDTVFVGEFTVYSHMDYIKAYSTKGYAKSLVPTYISSVPENEDWDYPVATTTSGYTIRKDTLDGESFKIVNDTQIVTQASFDYENKDRWFFMLDTGSAEVLYQVNVDNVIGVFDENGPATAAIAAKYPHVNEGDYIYWNFTSEDYIYDVSGINVSYPNKILVHSKKYRCVTIDLENAHGNSNAQQVVVTNFLGQVECNSYGFSLRNLDANRLTGRYDSANGYGHSAYKGWEAGYEFPHGTFGIYANNKWYSEKERHNINLNTKATRVELDYIEAANGGFTGISWKHDNDTANTFVTDSSTVHHCFIHDVGSEGIYIGSTQSGVQQVFTNMKIENNVILRCGGEGIQAGWLYGENVIKNNVVHSGVDWKRPFDYNQDGVIQVSVVGGGTVVKDNIFFGGGEAAGIIELKDNITPNPVTADDTVTYANNLFYAMRSGKFVHYGLYNDSFTKLDSITHLVFDGNYYKMIGDDYTELDTATNFSHTIWSLNNSANTTIARNNKYDNSIDSLVRTNFVTPVLSNNTQQAINYPQFRNYLNLPDSFNYLNISRYTDSTIKGNSAIWSVGNIVQHWNSNGETRFYECIQATSSTNNQPPSDDSNTAYWQLMTWQKADSSISYFPPDDVRLVASSFFDSLGMGISDSAIASSMVVPIIQNDKQNTISPQGTNKTNGNTPETSKAEQKPEFNVYPNPATNAVHINSNTAMQSIAVFNMLGEKCHTVETDGRSAATLDLQKLSNGLYIIRVYSSDGQTAVKKIQILK